MQLYPERELRTPHGSFRTREIVFALATPAIVRGNLIAVHYSVARAAADPRQKRSKKKKESPQRTIRIIRFDATRVFTFANITAVVCVRVYVCARVCVLRL